MGPLNLENIGFLVGGLSIFLFGLITFSEYLKEVAGVRLKSILDLVTKSPFVGFLTGMIITSIIQSSSVFSVVVLAFVNSGLITFEQSLGLIFGTNVGTTITAQIVAFNITQWGFYFIPIGLLVYFIGKKKRIKYLGQSITAFGFLLIGLFLIEKGIKPLKNYDPFIQLMLSFKNNPFKGILTGAIFTGIIQSSSVTTSLVVTLAKQGLITLGSAIPIVLGANIGTTVTAGIASIGSKLSARRVALAHFLFNLFGVLLLYPIIKNGLYEKFVIYISSFIPNVSVERMVANSHTIFNIIWSVFWLFLTFQFASIVKSILRGKEKIPLNKIEFLDKRFLSTPSLALDACKKELQRMSNIAFEMIDTQINVITGKLPFKEAKNVLDLENLVNEVHKETLKFLRDLYEVYLTDEESELAMILLQNVDDIERWGDHATNLYEVAEFIFENNVKMNTNLSADVSKIYNLVQDNLQRAISLFGNIEENKAQVLEKAIEVEEELDLMVKKYRKESCSYYIKGESEINIAVIFTDIITNLERAADHAFNIIISFTKPL
jgi:phosphate:Na+ symporter